MAFDGSPGARAALAAAALIARATDTPLRVIRVFARDLPTPPSHRLPPGFVRITADAEQAAREEFECAIAELAGADAEAAFLIGDPADELPRESEVCDRMVIGSRGYGPAPAVLLGDVSGRLMRTAACPVVIVPNGLKAPLTEALRPQKCCDAVSLNQLPGLTLGELLDGDLGLELVAGGEDARHRRVAGAHSIEIDHPADWLGRHWVMLTTGVRLRHRVGAQRQLVAELEQIGAAALGFGVDVVFKRVPPALLDEARLRSRGLPVFAIPLRTPFRDVVSAVNASLLSTEVHAMQRLSSLQLHLMDALEEDDPRRAVIERLAAFVDATVTLFSPGGRVLRTTGRAPTEAIWHEITCRPAALMQFSSSSRAGETIATPLHREMKHGSWLAVSRGGSQPMAHVTRAAARATAPVLARAGATRSHDPGAGARDPRRGPGRPARRQ